MGYNKIPFSIKKLIFFILCTVSLITIEGFIIGVSIFVLSSLFGIIEISKKIEDMLSLLPINERFNLPFLLIYLIIAAGSFLSLWVWMLLDLRRKSYFDPIAKIKWFRFFPGSSGPIFYYLDVKRKEWGGEKKKVSCESFIINKNIQKEKLIYFLLIFVNILSMFIFVAGLIFSLKKVPLFFQFRLGYFAFVCFYIAIFSQYILYAWIVRDSIARRTKLFELLRALIFIFAGFIAIWYYFRYKRKNWYPNTIKK
jgi:hypothetical protein